MENRYKNYRIETARVKWHDYDSGMYFITICTKDKMCYLGQIINDEMHLSEIGKYLQENIELISNHYPYCTIPQYTIMPNHLHLIVCIDGITKDSPQQTSPLANIIRGMKSAVTKYAREHNIIFEWQSRYYDRIIRNPNECNKISEYIENNVIRWAMDEYVV